MRRLILTAALLVGKFSVVDSDCLGDGKLALSSSELGQSETSRDPAQVVRFRETSGRRTSALLGRLDSGPSDFRFQGQS